MSHRDSKPILRKNLNPAIQGPNTDALLEGLSKPGNILIHNVEAVNDQIYLATATGRYLDLILAGKNVTRPAALGIDDDVFREIGIEITNRKQVRDLINNILEIIYGPEYTRAQALAGNVEPYSLQDGDTLRLQFDDAPMVEITFRADQFTNINSASAQEVADAITRELRSKGSNGIATIRNDGYGYFVVVSSSTTGPSSSVRVFGGRAQNALKFPDIRATSADFSTQWDISIQPGGTVRMTWTGGANPSLGKAKVGDYVNIYGGSFLTSNQGTFTLTKVQGGSVNKAYVEFDNLNAQTQTATQGVNDAVLFYGPERITITDYPAFASAFQTESKTLQIFLPAITRVIRRDRIGSTHLNANPPVELSDVTGDAGSYLWDLAKPFTITKYSSTTSDEIGAMPSNVLNVANASDFPDQMGYFCLEWGTANEEGPVPYISRPSNGSLLLNPSYRFKKPHPVGATINLVGQNTAYTPATDGSDYGAYITDVVGGRVWAQELIDLVAAAGINLVFTVLYPDPIGLENWAATTDAGKAGWQKVFGE